MGEDQTGLFVDGEWRAGSGSLQVRDKVDDSVIAALDVPSPAQVDEALDHAAARADQPLPVRERARILRAAAAILREQRDQIVAAYAAETGFAPADGVTELDRTLQIYELSAQEAERLTGEVVPVAALAGHENTVCVTERVPVGLVVAISPFNAPLSTVAHKIAPALAAGNSVALKPAELTPLGAVAQAGALAAAGLPPGRLQLLCGPGETVGEQMVSHAAVRYVTFTGSTAVGRRIRARSGLARTHLELGSNSPTVVWSDADLERAVPAIVRAGYRKAGQVCTSVQRLLVHGAVVDDLVSALREAVSRLAVGDPRHDGVSVGPVISSSAGDRIEGLISDAVGQGAQLVAGGAVEGSRVQPAVLIGVPPSARLSTEEAFAPLVAISSVSSLDEAIDRANATPYGLQAGVFCQDLDVAYAFLRGLRMGGVVINDTSSYHPDSMPYGGVKDSGHGLEGPHFAVSDMTDTKTMLLRLRPEGPR